LIRISTGGDESACEVEEVLVETKKKRRITGGREFIRVTTG
jgi:hypothetical protein